MEQTSTRPLTLEEFFAVASLATNFKIVVDEHIDDCAERGVEAKKSKISISA